MTTDLSSAMTEAKQAAEGGLADGFVERLAERIGMRAGVQAVFGEPIERGGLTVVPVARVRWGFGGGAGSGPTDESGRPVSGSGSGGGGGVAAEPIGFLEIGPDGVTFRPIVQPYPSAAFLLASGLAVAAVLRAMARLMRR